jgi:hypothetical protein
LRLVASTREIIGSLPDGLRPAATNDVVESAPVVKVVVSPHLDDAVLSVYGQLGPETTVVTVLAGLPPEGYLSDWDGQSGATDSRARIIERREEDRRALERSTAVPVHLDFPDRQYVALGMPKPSPAGIAEALGPHLDDADEVLAPAALSTNSRNVLRRLRRRRGSDHRLIRDAVLRVRPDATLYAELPYALSEDRGFTLPPELRRPRRRQREHVLRPELLGDKIASVRCYGTQLDPLIAIFGDFLAGDQLGREVLWDAPAVTARRR